MTYYVRVRAYRLVGTTNVYSAYSTVVQGKPIPSTPVITVASLGYNSLKATWATISGASGYEVSYSTAQAGTYTVLPLTTSVSAWIPGLLTNTVYYVRVRAYRLVGTVKVYSAYSTVIQGKPTPSTPVITVTRVSSTSLKVNWTGISGAGGYEVWKSTGTNTTYTQLTAGTNTTYTQLTTVTTTYYTNSALVTATNYNYKVRAYRLVETIKVYSYFSAILSGTP